MMCRLLLEGKTYGELFASLVQSDIVPLGLYRNAAVRQTDFPFVFSAPPTTTTVHSQDKVFVVTTKDDRSNETVVRDISTRDSPS
jgi:hypothetical protein